MHTSLNVVSLSSDCKLVDSTKIEKNCAYGSQMLLEEMASKISKQDTHKHSYFVGRILDSLAYEHKCQRLLVGYKRNRKKFQISSGGGAVFCHQSARDISLGEMYSTTSHLPAVRKVFSFLERRSYLASGQKKSVFQYLMAILPVSFTITLITNF